MLYVEFVFLSISYWFWGISRSNDEEISRRFATRKDLDPKHTKVGIQSGQMTCPVAVQDDKSLSEKVLFWFYLRKCVFLKDKFMHLLST